MQKGKPEWKKQLGGPRRRRVDNIKTCLIVRELGWYCMDLIDVAQYRGRWRALVSAVIKFRVW
jgi:hypothetical protein